VHLGWWGACEKEKRSEERRRWLLCSKALGVARREKGGGVGVRHRTHGVGG
jgi:hypothetical protein